MSRLFLHGMLAAIAFICLGLTSSDRPRQFEHISREFSATATSSIATTPICQASDTDRADKLFEQKKWREAREAYDEVKSSHTSVQRHVVERSITCSLMLQHWDVALSRALFFKSKLSYSLERNFYWPTDREDLAQRLEYLDHLEFVHRLFKMILEKVNADGSDAFREKVTTELIALDFTVLQLLDPDSTPRGTRWSSSRYASMQWWWEGMRSQRDDFESDDPYDYWYWREGIPVIRSQAPVFRSAPSEYASHLGRAEKVLYLLDEIQRLDSSEEKRESARAQLHSADLKRRLYGPSSDPAWNNAEFYYRYAKRPSFEQYGKTGLKQLWELADDEARGLVGRKLRVITLPASENPLSIWHNVAESFANTGFAAEAIYQRGLYFQNRLQFSKAIHEYDRLLTEYPNDHRAEEAQSQIGHIKHADVLLGSTGIYAVGTSPSMWFACRNTATVELTARQVDLKGFLEDRQRKGHWSDIRNFGKYIFHHWRDDNEQLKEFVGDQVAKWSQAVPASDRVSTHATQIPIKDAGAYIVEARIPGADRTSQGLVILSETAIIQKPLPGKVLLWVVDAITGRPLANQEVRMIKETRRREWTSLTTDQDGAIYLEPTGYHDTFVWLETDHGGLAFSEVARAGYSQFGEVEHRHFGITDRPLYRPGSTVNFRIWTREMDGRQYRPAQAGDDLRVRIEGPNYNDTVRSFLLPTDQSGSVSGSFELDSEAALGQYEIRVQRPSERHSPLSCRFRVEEYKKPEFEVSVLPSKETARVGESIDAVIQANYYTGQPVAGADVRYRIIRRSHYASYDMPSRWDWLYGKGFGDYSYLYPWLGDSVMRMDNDWYGYRGSFYNRNSQGDLVEYSDTRLDEDGIAKIHIDTAAFAHDVDHEFEIVAQVRDESRRTIEGKGRILATRQQFNAFTRLDRGWYKTGNTGQATVLL